MWTNLREIFGRISTGTEKNQLDFVNKIEPVWEKIFKIRYTYARHLTCRRKLTGQLNLQQRLRLSSIVAVAKIKQTCAGDRRYIHFDLAYLQTTESPAGMRPSQPFVHLRSRDVYSYKKIQSL